MTAVNIEALLSDIRNYLDITWTDTEGDRKLKGIIERGIRYLDGIAGEAQDYLIEAEARGLLFDYCRYARSYALEDFQNNFAPELLGLRLAVEVKRHEEESNTNI